MDVAINNWAVLVAAVASAVIGAVWYSPFMFGNAWMRLLGRSEEEVKKGNPKRAMIGSFITTLITAYVLAMFVGYIDASTPTDGLQLGFWVWLGFVATVGFNTVLFEGKPRRLYLINATYQLISLLVMAMILAMWQ